MPRLTAELIADSPQFTNAVKDWELDLRGNKIAVIENLGATLDQFDTIDFSDNEIRKLEGFPLLTRLKSVLLSNNRVCRIAEGLEESLPQLQTLVLVNNSIEELHDLDPLASLHNLTYLSLLRNPVVHKPSYRHYVIHKIPQLRVLDFRRIRLKEREKAAELFGAEKPSEEEKAAAKKPKKFTPGEGLRRVERAPVQQRLPSGPSAMEKAKIRAAIASAKSLEEVHQLEAMLKAGQIPGQMMIPNSNHYGEQEMEN